MSKLDNARKEINIIDAQIAELFEQRMKAAEIIASEKVLQNLPIRDTNREKEVIEASTARIGSKEIQPYFRQFMEKAISLSRQYQKSILSNNDEISVLCKDGEYRIISKNGCIHNANNYLNLNRKVLIVTDDGVPSNYSKVIAEQCKDPYTIILPQGEGKKSINTFETLLKKMQEHHFNRSDCIVAVGGGTVGDVAGFAASCFMRGIDFYNVPTTILAQVDSSIGGKTAININSVKNSAGTFYNPKYVLADPDTIKTLDSRQISNGLAEALKMAITCDENLFNIIEDNTDISQIIRRSILIKKSIVEQDEKDEGIRRVLNFGHTIGHAVESCTELLHGECVALGILAMCENEVAERLRPVYRKLDLPEKAIFDLEKARKALIHDKKSKGNIIKAVTVNKIGNYEFVDLSINNLTERLSVINGVK